MVNLQNRKSSMIRRFALSLCECSNDALVSCNVCRTEREDDHDDDHLSQHKV